MNKIRVVLFALVMISAHFVFAGSAAADDVSVVCATARLGLGLGAGRVDLTLSIDLQGPFAELAGEARFSQPVAPPGSLIIYAVSGTAIPNADGWWISLAGIGYDLAKTIHRGTFAIQLSTDPTKSTFSYTRQNLDGSAPSTSTTTIPLTAC